MHIMCIVILLLYLQNYIGEKVGPDEKLPWAQSVIRRGFIGEVWLTCSHFTLESEKRKQHQKIKLLRVMHWLEVKQFSVICFLISCYNISYHSMKQDLFPQSHELG